MKNADIQELQSILTGEFFNDDYITESTSRSLREVKQYQQKQTSMFNDKNKQQLKIFLRNKLRRNGRNSLVCNIKKDVDCKTDNELAMFNILKNVCDRYQGYTKLERIDGKRKSVKSDTYTAEKMRICELFGLDGKKYGIEEEEIHDDWIYLKFNEFNNIRNIFPVNKRTYYRFIHFTRKKNLTELSPTLGSSHFNSGYANDTVFFFAIKRGAYMPDVLRRGLNYGDNAYEYIPRATDNIYLDFTDTKPTMRDSVIPVYIETKQSLPVKKIEFDREGFKESYIDETIDRFDAFMEEYNETGCIPDEEYFQEGYIMESAQDDKYAKITQDYIKKSGRASLRYKRGEDYLPQEVVDRIVYLCNKLLEFPVNGNYNQYKTYYDTLCKIVHHPNTTNISYDVLNKAVYSGYINFGMNAGGKRLQHRCYLKPGTRLYHTSENGNMSILKPNVFIGDDVFYAAPRIYFYCEAIGGRYGSPSKPVKYDANNKPIITEEMKRRFKHVYMYTVKPGDSIFFDNELNSEKNTICGAVYLAYTKPIKLTKIY